MFQQAHAGLKQEFKIIGEHTGLPSSFIKPVKASTLQKYDLPEHLVGSPKLTFYMTAAVNMYNGKHPGFGIKY